MKKLLVFIIALCCLPYSYAQDKKDVSVSESKTYGIDSVTVMGHAWFFNSQGNVYDFENNPLSGVVVTYRSKRGVFRDTTDLKGKFYIDSILGKKGLLRFNKEGYKALAQNVSSSVNIYITLFIDPEGMLAEQEVGYGTTNKYKKTSATTHISGEMVNLGVKQDIVQCLAGKGGLSADLKIRGSQWFPLIVVNGVTRSDTYTDLNSLRESLRDINPEDVEYVEVLKDAAATAVYGMRGGNGVLLIRTKSSRSAKKPKKDVSETVKSDRAKVK